jgi:hypothetical protein
MAIEVMVALTAIWAGRVAWQVSRQPLAAREEQPVRAPQWMMLGLLGAATLMGTLCLGPLVSRLADATNMASLHLPTRLALVRSAAMGPAPLAAVALAFAVRSLQRRSRPARLASAVSIEEAPASGPALVRRAQALRLMLEKRILEQMSGLVTHTVVDGARLVHGAVEQNGLESILRRIVEIVVGGSTLIHRAVERRGLEGLLEHTVRIVMAGARLMHGNVEQDGFEDLPRRTQQAVLTLSRRLQQWHPGRLRRNLLWVAASLALVVLALMLHGW